jgi:hypothetical protein
MLTNADEINCAAQHIAMQHISGVKRCQQLFYKRFIAMNVGTRKL